MLREMQRRRFGRRGGFVNNLWISIRAMQCNLDFTNGIELTRPGTTNLDLFNTAPAKWGHEVRELMRQKIWRFVEKERKRSGDASGLADGVNRVKSLKLYHSSGHLQQGVLRRILLGSVWTNVGLSHMPRLGVTRTCTRCPAHADPVDEDMVHLWWKCPAWTSTRERCFRDVAMPAVELLPKCFAAYGLVPNSLNLSQEVITASQRMMVQIFQQRFADLDLNNYDGLGS